MRPPLELDIGWRDLARAGLFAAFAHGRTARMHRVEELWGPRGYACLSIRSGLDAFLGVVGLPAGSEVLVSGYTIPDMVRVLEAHRLVPVAVDLDLETLAPTAESLRAACTERTRAILVAHLFGSLVDLDPIAEFAEERGLLLLEDGAQVYGPAGYRGHPRADLAMFSFGTIKTATSLGGALFTVREEETLAALRTARDARGEWPRAAFLRKVLKGGVMKLLSQEFLYGGCVRACALAGADHEEVLHRSARGFHGELMAAIRHAPNAPLLALLEHRLRSYPAERVTRRAANAREQLAHLPHGVRAIGREAPLHSHWVLTLTCDAPDALVDHLRARGFDATRAATATAIDRARTPNCARLADTLVYVPCGADLTAISAARLGVALEEFAPERQALPVPG